MIVEQIYSTGKRTPLDVNHARKSTEGSIRINGKANAIGGIERSVFVEIVGRTYLICQTGPRGAKSAENPIFMLTSTNGSVLTDQRRLHRCAYVLSVARISAIGIIRP